METKKAVVKTVRMSRDKTTAEPSKDQYGNYSFTVTFDNGDSGFHRSKEEVCFFKEGQEMEYAIEKKVGSTGKEYFNITRPKTGFQGRGGGSWQPKTPQQVKTEARSMLLRYAVDMFIEDKIAYDKIGETFQDLLVMYDGAVDSLTSGTA